MTIPSLLLDQFTEQSRSVPVGIQRWCVSSNLIRRDMVELGTLPYCLTSGFAIFSEIQRFPQLLPNTTGAGLGTLKDECLFKGTVIYCPKLQLRYTQTGDYNVQMFIIFFGSSFPAHANY